MRFPYEHACTVLQTKSEHMRNKIRYEETRYVSLYTPLTPTSNIHTAIDDFIDLDLTIDPAPPGGIFGTMLFLYLMICSIQKTMIAHFCGGVKELWALRYHLNCSVYLTLKHPCIKLFK